MIALLLALACGGGDPAEAEPAYVLDAPAYRFCHEAGFQRGEAEAWCDLVDEIPAERCPGLHETCKNPDAEDRSTGCNQGQGGQGGNTPAEGPREPRKPPEACDMPDSSADTARTLLKWLAAIGVAAIVLVLLRVFVGYFGRTPKEPARGLPIEEAPPADEALPDVPALPSADLLAHAQAALDGGRYGEAVLLARGAALRRLGEAGVLRLHRARTDREYARQARRDDRVGDALGVIVRAVEAHRFGGRALDADHAGAALAAARRIVGIAVVLLFATDARAQGYGRHGPFGDAALYDLFQDYGHEVSWLSTPLVDIGEETDALVLDLAGIVPSDEDWAALRLWVEAGGVLVVAGDAPVGFPEVGAPGRLASPAPAAIARALDPYLPAPIWPDGAEWVWTYGQAEPWVVAVGPTAPDEAAEVSLADGDTAPVVVAVDVGAGVVVGIADGLLLTNGALVHPANERFLGELLHVGQGPFGWPLPDPIRVTLATRSSSGQSQPPPAAANPRLIPFALQLMLTWTLLAAWLGWPFGVPRDPPGEGRRRFVDHVTALATRYMRLGATGYAHAVTARLWLARLGPAGLELAARRAGYGEAEAKRFVRETEAAATGPTDGREPEVLDKVEELWRVTRGTSR